ncbi:MAG: CoA transferase [Alphaproteobacteria bacterium]|nr:CoA transferase [Alphaproteobacteria bacterium]
MTLPLDGVRIIDLSAIISGPMATQILADQGADVIKVEAPGPGDIVRYLGPQKNGVNAMFTAVNRNKRGIVLNLKSSDGRQILIDLVKTADVFVENFRPGAIEKLGLGYDKLKTINPGLVYVSMSGFGDTGPYAKRRVYDPVIQATSGFSDTQKNTVGEPQLIQTLAVDKTMAITAAQAITAALYAKARGRGGRLVEISMLDTAIAFLWPDAYYNLAFEEGANRAPDFASFYSIRKTKDGYITMIAISDDEFRATCRALARPDIADDPRFKSVFDRMQNAKPMTDLFAGIVSQMATAEITARLEAEDVPHARVLTREQVLTNEQVVANRSIVTFEDPRAGKIRLARSPAKFDGEPPPIRRHAPSLGEHTDEVLRELGRSPEDIVKLRANNAIT